MFSFVDFSALFTCILSYLLRESAVLGSKFCPVCELYNFTLHLSFHSRGPQIVFWTHPSWVAGKYICHELACHFRLILAFLTKKYQKYGEGMVLSKNKCCIWTQPTQIPLRILLSEEKNFGT